MTLRFEAPPMSRGANSGTRVTLDDIEQLKKRKGEWAVVREPATRVAAYATAHQIRTGTLTAFRPAGSFEAQGRTIREPNGSVVYRVFAKYVGPDTEA